MKRAAIVALCLVGLFVSKVDAQSLYLGARVGANFANQSYNFLPTGFSTGINTGLLIGGEVDLPFGNVWTLSLQALYDQKGTNQKLTNAMVTTEESPEAKVVSGTFEQDFNYLEVPILLKACWSHSEIRPYVFAGPSFGLFLNGSQSLAASSRVNGGTESITSYQSIASSSVNSPDISALAGAGIELRLDSNAELFGDVSYALGLVNIAKAESWGSTTIRSRDIRLAAGILFPLH